MRIISRRAIVGALAAAVVPRKAHAASPEDISADDSEGRMALTRYAARDDGQRPAVLILHGGRGVELKPHTYERHADAVSSGGLDAYLLRYFTDADHAALDQRATTAEGRDAYRTRRFDGWAKRVSSAVTAILARPESSGQVGLLGFSLGSYVAAATAALDDRIGALAAMYGGMPDAMVSQVRHLPPLIELHGEADRIVPLAKGTALVALARSVGAPAEQVTYPGREHGFDFSDTDPMTADAIGRIVRFFRAYLFAA